MPALLRYKLIRVPEQPCNGFLFRSDPVPPSAAARLCMSTRYESYTSRNAQTAANAEMYPCLRAGKSWAEGRRVPIATCYRNP